MSAGLAPMPGGQPILEPMDAAATAADEMVIGTPTDSLQLPLAFMSEHAMRSTHAPTDQRPPLDSAAGAAFGSPADGAGPPSAFVSFAAHSHTGNPSPSWSGHMTGSSDLPGRVADASGGGSGAQLTARGHPLQPAPSQELTVSPVLLGLQPLASPHATAHHHVLGVGGHVHVAHQMAGGHARRAPPLATASSLLHGASGGTADLPMMRLPRLSQDPLSPSQPSLAQQQLLWHVLSPPAGSAAAWQGPGPRARALATPSSSLCACAPLGLGVSDAGPAGTQQAAGDAAGAAALGHLVQSLLQEHAQQQQQQQQLQPGPPASPQPQVGQVKGSGAAGGGGDGGGLETWFSSELPPLPFAVAMGMHSPGWVPPQPGSMQLGGHSMLSTAGPSSSALFAPAPMGVDAQAVQHAQHPQAWLDWQGERGSLDRLRSVPLAASISGLMSQAAFPSLLEQSSMEALSHMGALSTTLTQPGALDTPRPLPHQPPAPPCRSFCCNCTMPLDAQGDSGREEQEGQEEGASHGPHHAVMRSSTPLVLACPFCHYPVHLPPIDAQPPDSGGHSATTIAAAGLPGMRQQPSAGEPVTSTAAAAAAAGGGSPLWALSTASVSPGPQCFPGNLMLALASPPPPLAAEGPSGSFSRGLVPAQEDSDAMAIGCVGVPHLPSLPPPPLSSFGALLLPSSMHGRAQVRTAAVAASQPPARASMPLAPGVGKPRDAAMTAVPAPADDAPGTPQRPEGAETAAGAGTLAGPGWDGQCTVVGYDTRMLAHQEPPSHTGREHPERPNRLVAIMGQLRATGLLDKCKQVAGRPATDEELEAVHDPELLRQVALASAHAATAADGRQQPLGDAGAAEQLTSAMRPNAETGRWILDCPVNGATSEAARLAAGIAVDVALAVLSRHARNGAAIVRPPGHHAESALSMGFCVYNNAAVAAKAALQAGARRVLIMDFDVHHGNGTQHLFYDDPTVMYISTHRWDDGYFFPGTGAARESGVGLGAGFTVNVPWDGPGVTDDDELLAFRHVVMPIARAFSPDLVIVSAGFDAAAGDPLGECLLTPGLYGHLTHMLLSLGPCMLLLEGGYNLAATAACTAECVRVLLGGEPALLAALQRPLGPDGLPALQPSLGTVDSVLQTLAVHVHHWPAVREHLALVQQLRSTLSVQRPAAGGLDGLDARMLSITQLELGGGQGGSTLGEDEALSAGQLALCEPPPQQGLEAAKLPSGEERAAVKDAGGGAEHLELGKVVAAAAQGAAALG